MGLINLNQITCSTETRVFRFLGSGFKARFHYERGILFYLLIFPRLKSKRALSEAKKLIKQTKNTSFTLVVKASLKFRSR